MSSTTFDTRSVTVRDLLNSLSDEPIVIPVFQRGYEWKAKQVEAFWGDIYKFHSEKYLANNSQAYFLGPIVTLTKPRERIELLDGQQRLVTITILFSVIRDLAAGLSDAGKDVAADTQKQMILKESGERMLRLSETDDDLFRDVIQSFPPQNPTGRKLRTHKNILAARDYFKSELEKICPASNPIASVNSLKELRKTLFTDVKMASIPVDSDRDAIQIFTTLNNRGLRLAVPDLFLAYLIGKVPDRPTRDTVRGVWTTMVECLGNHDIDRFIRHFWVSRYGDLKSVDLFTGLQDFIEKQKNDPVKFVRDCASECAVYVALLDADEKELKEAAKHVKNLIGELGVKSSLPLLLSAYLHFEAADFVKICQWLIVFVVRYSVAGKLDASGMETIFFSLAKSIRKDGAEGVVTKVTRAMVRDTLEKNAPSTGDFETKVKTLILSPGEAKYIVRALANYIESPNKEKMMNESNVEHVYPQNPEPGEWGGQDNQDKMNEVLWNIGNLTIFGRRANSKAQNKEYAIKRPQYLEKSKVQMTINLANRYKEWTVEKNLERAEHMAEPAKEIWNFDNPSRV